MTHLDACHEAAAECSGLPDSAIISVPPGAIAIAPRTSGTRPCRTPTAASRQA